MIGIQFENLIQIVISLVVDLNVVFLLQIQRENANPETESVGLIISLVTFNKICMDDHWLHIDYDIRSNRFNILFNLFFFLFDIEVLLELDPNRPDRIAPPLRADNNDPSSLISDRTGIFFQIDLITLSLAECNDNREGWIGIRDFQVPDEDL